MSRKEIDELTKFVGIYGAKGLAYIKVQPDDWQSPIVKFFSDTEKAALKKQLNMETGDLVLFGAGSLKVVNDSLGNLREKLAAMRGLIPEDALNFLWVVDFPMFEYDDETKRYYAVHHPFTAPKPEHVGRLDSDPSQCFANAYDLV